MLSAEGTGKGHFMPEHLTTPLEEGLHAEISDAIDAVRTRYAGKGPVTARTEIRGNVVTCVLADAASDPDPDSTEVQAQSGVPGTSTFTRAAYKSEAAATVANLMGRPVTSFSSSQDADTHAATETFTLERRLFS
jgi:uncharacterized protein YbcI